MARMAMCFSVAGKHESSQLLFFGGKKAMASYCDNVIDNAVNSKAAQCIRIILSTLQAYYHLVFSLHLEHLNCNVT